MKYMGSKRRIAEYILPIILKDRKPDQWYVEPFCGGCNVIDKVAGNRIANDRNEYVAAMWDALVNKDWIPPTQITEEHYNDIKTNKEKYERELVGFAGIQITFGSTWFGTYARCKRGVNYAMEGRKNLLEQVERLQGTIFQSGSYDKLFIPKNSIIYCDPPYAGVAGYKDKFDNTAFWKWCRKMSLLGHTVFISEYKAPEDFICVWEMELKTNMNAKYETKPVEKLFQYCDLL